MITNLTEERTNKYIFIKKLEENKQTDKLTYNPEFCLQHFLLVILCM